MAETRSSGRRSSDPDVAAMQETLNEIQNTLGEVHEEAKKTNGRVTALEIARAVNEALAKRNVLGRDWLLRVLVVAVAIAALVEPVVLYLLAK